MESLLLFTSENAIITQSILVILILLAGINFPISSDIVLISSGALASTCAPHLAFHFFISIFLACWISAWLAYWFGRLLGPKLSRFRWFDRILGAKRIKQLHYYYEKFGFLTFLIGRFIPGGVRNALFMTSGMGKMPFLIFILRDFPACLALCAATFYLGYEFGLNYHTVLAYIKTYHTYVILTLASAAACFFFIAFIKEKRKSLKDPKIS